MVRRDERKKLELLENGNAPSIEHAITDSEMDRLLHEDLDKGFVSGAHWFRDADKWYRMNFAFNNPLNLGSIHGELLLIVNHQDDLARYLRDRQLIFYGVGTGDTEMALVNICLEHWDYAEIIAIDINNRFLVDFAHSIRAKMKEDKRDKARFLGIQNLFEKITPESLLYGNTNTSRRAFICLGNTIGNYSSINDLISMISKCASPKDIMILGYQTNAHIQSLYSKYSSNKLLSEMLLGCVSDNQSALTWKLDDETSTITAHTGRINLFRSIKFSPLAIASCAETSGWINLSHLLDPYQNVAIDLFQFI